MIRRITEVPRLSLMTARSASSKSLKDAWKAVFFGGPANQLPSVEQVELSTNSLE